MPTFPLHTEETAPAASQPAMQALQGAFGALPNIARAMATSPALINSLVAVFQQVHGGGFSEDEIQVVLLTNAVANGSRWPVAFHTTLALKTGVAAEAVEAIRNGSPPRDPRRAALSNLARALIETRGRLTERDKAQFLAAGFGEAQLLDVIAIVAASTITNYTASVTEPPLEPPFDAHVWTG